ncbi:hypothetical protein M569_10938 [Genlisea aurea]|uniref:S1 motif domain-containing protein n=1 Tax=Genlisea aurea TaxID=192259 RepID=S8CH49_9LAMI|nr:hypothetical protein M569_10938 [Genlisea aurea]
MREVQLSLNNSQKRRLQRAYEKLEALSVKVNSDAAVTVADDIPVNSEDAIPKGHGTADMNGRLVATQCGVVERINKLVFVRPLRARYKPEIGEIIVGRVVEVTPKRWKVEINSSLDAVLMLSSMNLPDGIQARSRRRTAIDELNMRYLFQENDVICAEVRGFQHDGGLHLQARSQKYGKLKRGQLVTVSPYQVRRKQQFHFLKQFGIDLILGCNGFIWIGEHVEVKDGSNEDHPSNNTPSQQTAVDEAAEEETNIPLETRESICRIANAVRVLSALDFMISLEVILEIVDLSLSLNVGIHDMLGAEFYVLVAEKEAERRQKLSTKRR